jgi:DNA modification methylase
MNKGICLHNGDCLEVMDELISDGIVVDAIITDPPYGTTACKWDSIIPFDEMWTRLNKLIKQNGAIVLFGSEPFSSALRMSNISMFKYDWIWEKTTPTGHLNAKKQPMRVYEIISVFYNNQPTYNPQKTFGHVRKTSTAKNKANCKKGEVYRDHGLTTYYSTERYPRNVITFSTDKQKEALHPTQKPVSLMEYLIKTYTNEGELVLDFTMGSGTTGVACVNTNRKFIGIELDDKYFEIASNRIKGENNV